MASAYKLAVLGSNVYSASYYWTGAMAVPGYGLNTVWNVLPSLDSTRSSISYDIMLK